MNTKPIWKVFTVLTVAIFAQGCASTTRVTPVAQVVQSGRGGVVYALPATVLDIDVPIDRVTQEPAKTPYKDFTNRLFGQDPEVSVAKKTFAIGLPTIATSGQPDQSKIYYAEINGGPLSDTSLSLNFDTKGVLTSSITESENKTVDFVVSTLETGAKIAGSAAKLISETESRDIASAADIPPVVRKAYERIKTASDTKTLILSGMGSDLQARLAEVNEGLKKDLALFFGSKTKETWTVQFRVVPKATATSIALFSYLEDAGITDFHVTPRNRIKDGYVTHKLGPVRLVRVDISSITPLVADSIATGRLFTQQERGLHYNIPAAATVAIYDGTTKLMTASQSFGQLGSVGFLPISTGSRKLHQEITLDGTTGALLAFKNSSNAFDPQNINKIGTAASGLMDAMDPKLKLERERDMAKAQFELLDYEKKARDKQAEIDATKKTAEKEVARTAEIEAGNRTAENR